MSLVRPVDAAFEGFRIVREKPGLVLAWTGFYLLFLLAIVLVLLLPNLGALPAVERYGSERNFEELWARFGPSILVAAPLSIAMITVLPSAILRSILRPAESRHAYLRLGMDELRLFGLYLLIVVLIVPVTTGLYQAAVVFLGRYAGPLSGLVAGLGAIGGLLLVIWLFVRLSLSGAVIFAERRLRIDHAWRMTHGNFWQLLATLLLGVLFFVGVMVASLLVSFLLAKFLGGFSLVGELVGPGPSAISRGEALLLLGQLAIQYAILMLLVVLAAVIFIAAQARAYLQIMTGTAAPASAEP